MAPASVSLSGLEKLEPYLLFQSRDLEAYRGLRFVETFGGRAKTSLVANCDTGAQQVVGEIHKKKKY
jgi:hypothetical protein